MSHTHSPQTINGRTLYVCSCGARKQKSQIINGVKVEVWTVESKTEEAARERAIEMIETEGYGYGKDVTDPLDSHHPDFKD